MRSEILENIHFTPKETDIYKIHQSGDLANLSGLPSAALQRLPSLLKLRDALYSAEFRAWIAEVAGAGPLSGTKTDMAVNVYAPGCHLLCHDDVIGSRRVSYILYLTDPDTPWKAEWGGALRLYPTEKEKSAEGKEVLIPQSEWTKVIPPAWNQLSFFAVQPGESFHDVEEVYKRAEGESKEDGGRIRMAISGWFHIPQEGEDGFVPGLEEKLAERSTLQQLQGGADEFDKPQTKWWDYSDKEVARGTEKEGEEVELTEEDLEFLLKFMTPHYLTPDTVEELSELFAEESSLQLANFLSKKYSAALKEWLSKTDQDTKTWKESATWKISNPPHKHRYMYRQPQLQKNPKVGKGKPLDSVYDELVEKFLPSLAFKKWLSLATGLTLKQSSLLARRFRRGLDYTLATSHDQEDPHLEFCLNITPTTGWGADEHPEGEEADGAEEDSKKQKKSKKTNGKAKKEPEPEPEEDEDNVGGYEIYMAGDDDDDDMSVAGNEHENNIPQGAANPSATGAGNRRSSKRKADPAIYRASADDEDDGILFSNPAAWNTMSIVLRDRGVLKFVKYVSKAAKGDRWDVTGAFEVEDDDDDDDDEEENADDGEGNGEDEEDEDEEEWNGFSD